MKYIFALVLVFISSNIFAQEIKPKGQFLKDTLKIGEPVPFSLALKYPKELDVVFPDSLFDFSPYELERKIYSPTRSDAQYSYDSAVYYISSFEIDSVQYFKLPVFIINSSDSTTIYTAQDSIILKQLVASVPDSVSAEAAPLIENTDYINVPLQFNYPYLIIGLIILIIVVILIIFLFGKRIKNYFILRRIKKNHQQFINNFETLQQKQNEPKSKLAENLLIHWKKYLEKLESRPYTKLTTKEIIMQYNPETIADDLKLVDRAIYASAQDNSVDESFNALKEFANHQYEHKVEEVKNG